MDDKNTTANRLRLALDMFELGMEMMRRNLQRRYPEESSEIIDQRLEKWLSSRDCAPKGDAEGRVLPVSRLEDTSP